MNIGISPFIFCSVLLKVHLVDLLSINFKKWKQLFRLCLHSCPLSPFKRGSSLKGKNLLIGAIFFPFSVTPTSKGGKMVYNSCLPCNLQVYPFSSSPSSYIELHIHFSSILVHQNFQFSSFYSSDLTIFIRKHSNNNETDRK